MSEQGDGGGEADRFAESDLAGIPVVILAGGRGARFDHESRVLPKPMIEVAGRPILQHIIDGFALQGFREFIVATGYLGHVINGHFERVGDDAVFCPRLRDSKPCHWVYTLAGGMLRVTVVHTGLDAHTGLRLSRLSRFIAGRDFVLTYGDGLCDVNMRRLITVHRRERPHLGLTVTVTAVNPPGRFGAIEMEPGTGFPHFRQVRSFDEKPRTEQWINGGFMFVENSFLDEYIGEARELESEALRKLADDGWLCAYCHTGYWACMDTRRDLERIEADVAAAGRLPWLPATSEGGIVAP